MCGCTPDLTEVEGTMAVMMHVHVTAEFMAWAAAAPGCRLVCAHSLN
jgi:hypothetical protein